MDPERFELPSSGPKPDALSRLSYGSFLEIKLKLIRTYGVTRVIVLGKAIVSIMCSAPVIHITNLSTPKPKPE